MTADPHPPAPELAKAPRGRTVFATFALAPGPRVVTREAQVVGGKGDLLDLVVPPLTEADKPLHLGHVRRAGEGELLPVPYWREALEVPPEPEPPRPRRGK